MFDLQDPDLTRVTHAESPLPDSSGGTDEAAPPAPADPLDQPEAMETFHRLLDAYVRELDRQELNRTEQATDEDFFDNEQWKEDDKRELEDRGQAPLVYNVISTAVNWVLGTEKRGRSDFHILPRRKEDAQPAERKSQILKYLSDCNRTGFHRSRAFADSVKVGIGWLEDAIQDGDDGEPITSRYESWRNMLWDSAGTEMDLDDSRYVFRSKWVDVDIAKAIFTNRAGLIEHSARDAEPLMLDGWYGDDAMDRAEIEMDRIGSSARMPNHHHRQRVRIIEAWFKKPVTAQRLSGGMFSGELFDEYSRGHVEAVNSGEARVVQKATMRVHCALMTTGGLLWLGTSPYRHNRYPFTPIWGNRRGRNGLPYGMIRGLRSINEDINKRASKALFHLSTYRVTAEEGAADDMDELFDEARRPDANLVVKAGKKVTIEDGRELADAELQMMMHSITMVQQASGVTDENQGRKTNATSGIAIERRQNQGALATTHYFDNLRLAFQVQGEKQLSLIEQFMGEKKEFRITNMRGKPEYVTVNDGLPENDIVRCKADYVISESDWRNSMREAAAAELMDLMVKLAPANPQLVMVMLDLVIESTDVHNREEIVRRIRQLTGMDDPDADPDSPEAQAKAAQNQATAEKKAAMEDAALRKLVAEAVVKEMQALKEKATAVRQNVASLGGPKRGALDIAADALTRPEIAPVVDDVLHDLGFVGRYELEHAAAVAAAQAAQPQLEQPGVGPQPAQPNQPPPEAIAHLKANPQLAADFDAKYGAGAAAKAMGQ